MPESPRYRATLKKYDMGSENIRRVYHSNFFTRNLAFSLEDNDSQLRGYPFNQQFLSDLNIATPEDEPFEEDPWSVRAVRQLLTRSWRPLVALSLLCFFSDAIYFTLTWYNYNVFSSTWNQGRTPSPSSLPDTLLCTDPALWVIGSPGKSISVQDTLQQNSLANYVNAGAGLGGSLFLVLIINYIPRRVSLFYFSFFTTVVAAAAFAVTFRGVSTASVTTLTALLQFCLSIGPSALVFILLPEMFPTAYRGTLVSFATAFGRIGALLIRITDDKVSGGVLMGACLGAAALLVVSSLGSALYSALPPVQEQPRGSRVTSIEARKWGFVPSLVSALSLRNRRLEEISSDIRERVSRQDASDRGIW
ncbi:hypothetical protein GQ53DRAFT_743892 [Thozetella sp. PMI_491]|nr:hypothetical protein GQ53DRAFT_743892 [Thozetella sp. PMI_491]